MSCLQQYAELIQAVQTYITQQDLKGKWISTNRQNYEYFLQLAAAKAPPIRKPPAPVQNEIPTSIPPVVTAPLTSPLHPRHVATSPSLQENVQKVALLVPAVPALPAMPTAKESAKKQEPAPEIKAVSKDILYLKQIAIETIPASVPTDFTEMKTFFKENLPNVLLSETIADDAEAKALAQRWKAPPAEIVVLSFSDHLPEKAFLTNMSIALNQTFGSAKLLSAAKIEEEKGWDQLLKAGNLRLVIASHNSLHALPELMKHYHEEATGKHKLGRAQLFLLSDLSLYMQQPSLKASLWRALVQQHQKQLGNNY